MHEGNRIDQHPPATSELVERVREAVTEWWGSRCPDFDPDCPCCQAWRELDALTAQPIAVNATVASSEAPTADQQDDAEEAAWNWLDSKFLNVEAGDDPNDRTYGADDMVDAFMAGRTLGDLGERA